MDSMPWELFNSTLIDARMEVFDLEILNFRTFWNTKASLERRPIPCALVGDFIAVFRFFSLFGFR